MSSSSITASRRRAAVAVAAIVGVVLVVALAANADPGPLYEVIATKTPKPIDIGQDTMSMPSVAERSAMPPIDNGGRGAPAWLGDVLRLAAVAVVILVILRFLQLLTANLRQRGRRKATAATSGSAVELPELDEQQVIESFSTTLAWLRQGANVDDAILECWRRLVDLAKESGVRRRPQQTAEEFTLDVLAHSRARKADLSELADLYRSSMFSTHEAGEPERARAIACLERLHDALTAHVAPSDADPSDAGLSGAGPSDADSSPYSAPHTGPDDSGPASTAADPGRPS